MCVYVCVIVYMYVYQFGSAQKMMGIMIFDDQF